MLDVVSVWKKYDDLTYGVRLNINTPMHCHIIWQAAHKSYAEYGQSHEQCTISMHVTNNKRLTWTELHLHSSTDPQSWANQHHHVCEEPGGRSAWKALWLDMTAKIQQAHQQRKRYNNSHKRYTSSFYNYFLFTLLENKAPLCIINLQNCMFQNLLYIYLRT